jgi:hypothetical protein
VLACLPALERGKLRSAALAGIAASLAAYGLTVIAIWGGGSSQHFAKLVGAAFIIAVVLVYSCLISLVRLSPRYQPVLTAALGLAFGLGAIAIYGLWYESGNGYAELIGVVSVLLAAVTIAIPILHRAGGEVVEAPPPARFCPSCGAAVVAQSAEATCEACGARFRVTFLGGDGVPAA